MWNLVESHKLVPLDHDEYEKNWHIGRRKMNDAFKGGAKIGQNKN